MLITPSECSPTALFLDASWHMPNLTSPRSASTEFLTRRIPNSQFWDVDGIAEKSEMGLQHMLPSPETFAKACGKLGIVKGKEEDIVVYDSTGLFSGPRTSFTFAVRTIQNLCTIC